MWNMIYPILIILLSNIVYNVCTKSAPEKMNAFAFLSVTYFIAAIVSFSAFLISAKGKNIFSEYSKINFSGFVLGIVIVGLELGYIFAYRNGWKMNTVSVTANIALAVALIIVAAVFYGESITIRQVSGIVLCCAGLAMINI